MIHTSWKQWVGYSALCIGLLVPVAAFGQSKSGKLIPQYDVTLNVQTNNTLQVTERVVYDFGEKQFSKWSRNIPVSNLNLDITVKEATAQGQPQSTYTTERSDGQLLIDVNSGRQKFTGRHTFLVEYTVTGPLSYQREAPRSDENFWQQGPFRYYETFDEVYWNAIGNTWDVPISDSTVKVNLPEGVETSALKYSCYTGASQATTRQECNYEQNGRTITFTLNTTLDEEYFTVAVGFNKGVLTGVSSGDKRMFILMRYVLPGALVLIGLGALIWKYVRVKQGFTLKRPIVRQYMPPKDLRPAEVSRIYYQAPKSTEFSATIIDLAVRGVVKIREEEKDQWIGSKTIHKLILRDENYQERDDLKTYEKRLLKRIFEKENREEDTDQPVVNMDKLNQNHALAKYASGIQNQVYKDMNGDKYFRARPQRISGGWIGLGIVIGIAGFVSLGLGFFGWCIALIVLALGCIVLGTVIPKRTQAGIDVFSHTVGYKKYVKVAEKERLEFQEKENIFFELLPYAMVLGVADKWSKAFEDVVTKPPEWYEGSHATAAGFSTGDFAQSMESTGEAVGGSFSSGGDGGSGGASGGGGAAGGGAGGGGGGAG